jgi:uncharacterized RDD family membrane protein YckC
LQDARYAPPRAQVEDIEIPGGSGPALARRTQRFAAAMIDGTIILALMWVAGRLTSWDPWGDDALKRSLWEPVLLQTLFVFAIFVVVQGLLLARRGQTIGKIALRIRITRRDGSPVSLRRMLGLRYGVGYVFAIIPMLGQLFTLVDSLLIFRSSRRCLHDVMADTIVVKA